MTALAARVDADNPWPGLAAFDESASEFFHGRADEISRVLHTVLDNPMTVLYGRSGMGKTSLLRAGLFPRLRERSRDGASSLRSRRRRRRNVGGDRRPGRARVGLPDRDEAERDAAGVDVA